MDTIIGYAHVAQTAHVLICRCATPCTQKGSPLRALVAAVWIELSVYTLFSRMFDKIN